MITQLNLPLPFSPSRGNGLAHLFIDSGPEQHLLWIADGGCWSVPNPEDRMRQNRSMNRRFAGSALIASDPATPPVPPETPPPAPDLPEQPTPPVELPPPSPTPAQPPLRMGKGARLRMPLVPRGMGVAAPMVRLAVQAVA